MRGFLYLFFYFPLLTFIFILLYMPSKQTLIKQLTEEIYNLKKSPLYSYRVKNGYQPVIGAGSLDARFVLIGEAPGKNEALSGNPFCGSSGKVLDQLLESINLKREDVYITSVVNDRPPENRDPSPKEIGLYSPFLIRQLNIIQPRIIATLGRHSMNVILSQFGLENNIKPISQNHGSSYKTKTTWGEVVIIPLYHPAVALYNGSKRAILLEDFKMLKKFTNS